MTILSVKCWRVVLHCCCMTAWSHRVFLLLDKLNIDSLFNARIDYMRFVSFHFVVRSYKNIDQYIYLSYISICDQWSIFLCRSSRANELARALKRAELGRANGTLTSYNEPSQNVSSYNEPRWLDIQYLWSIYCNTPPTKAMHLALPRVLWLVVKVL
jgi:hypothetical protein